MKGTNTGIRLTLIKADEWDGNDGKRHRREQWAITGGEVSSKWSRKTDSMSAVARSRTMTASWPKARAAARSTGSFCSIRI